MAERSIYAPGGDGMTTGGLDGYLGPEAADFSNLPPALESPDHPAAEAEPVDCAGADKDSPVCQIAQAERELGKA